MARNLGTLTIDVIAEVGGFVAGMDKAERSAESWRKSVEKNAKAAGTALGTAIAAGITGLTVVLAKVVANTSAAEQEVAQLDAILKSTGNAAGFTRQQLLDMADVLSSKSTFSAGEIVDAQTRLLSYSGVLGTNIPRAMQAIIDQSARLGISVSQSAETIGRALESPAKAAAALAQSGFGAAFTKEVRGTIDELVKAGKEGEAQIMILEILEESYAGAAEAARNTFAGALKGLQNALNDLTTAKDGSLQAATDSVNDLVKTIQDPSTKKAFDDLLSYAVETAAGFARLVSSTGAALTQFLQLRDLRAGGSLSDAADSTLDARMVEITKLIAAERRASAIYGRNEKAEEERSKRINDLIAERTRLQRELTERIKQGQVADNFKGVTATVSSTGKLVTPESIRAEAAALAESAKARELAAKQAQAAQLALQRSYESTALQLQRQIELFDQSADGSERASELRKLNFEIEFGALRGINAQEQIRLRTLAAELDGLEQKKEANKKAADAVKDLQRLQDELNKKDERSIDLAKSRKQILDEAYSGKSRDPEYYKTANQIIGGVGSNGFTGNDPMFGGASGELSKIDEAAKKEEENYKYALERLNLFYQDRTDLIQEWQTKEAELKAEHEGNLAQLEEARNQVALTAAVNGFGAVADVTRTAFGEQSNLYKAAFVAQKAFSIAKAALAAKDAVSSAFSSGLPFPANLAAAAAAAAAVANLVSEVSAVGMAHDGIDSVPETGTWLLQKGERVTTASTSAKLDATLDRVNRDTERPTGGDTFEMAFNVNGSISDRERMMQQETVRLAVIRAKSEVEGDMASGRGISKVMRGTHTVKRTAR